MLPEMSEPWLADAVLKQDRDRAVATMFCPAARRGTVLAVLAFHVEIASIRDRVWEPTLGHVRLLWWREALDRVNAAEDPEAAPLLRVLAGARDWPKIRPSLAALVEARANDLDAPPFADAAAAESHVGAITVPLIAALAIAAGLLGGGAVDPGCGAGLRFGRGAARHADGSGGRAQSLGGGNGGPSGLAGDRGGRCRLRRNEYEIFDPRFTAPSRVTLGVLWAWLRSRR